MIRSVRFCNLCIYIESVMSRSLLSAASRTILLIWFNFMDLCKIHISQIFYVDVLITIFFPHIAIISTTYTCPTMQITLALKVLLHRSTYKRADTIEASIEVGMKKILIESYRSIRDYHVKYNGAFILYIIFGYTANNTDNNLRSK